MAGKRNLVKAADAGEAWKSGVVAARERAGELGNFGIDGDNIDGNNGEEEAEPASAYAAAAA